MKSLKGAPEGLKVRSKFDIRQECVFYGGLDL